MDGGQKATNEWAGLGAAYPDWMQDYVIKLMKDANANYIRWGHVAASPKQIQSANKYGLLVTQPGVDGEGGSSSYTQKTLGLRVEAFRDMLIQYRNNPSIIMWEVGNQADMMGTVLNATTVSGITGLNYSSSTGSLIQLLSYLINEYDYGNRAETISNSGSYDDTTDESTRLASVRRGNDLVKNYVEVGESTEGAGSMNTTSLGNKPAVEGEYNRLEVRRGVWDFKTTGFLNFFNVTNYGDDYKYVTNEEFAIAQITKKKNVLLGTNYVGGANWIFSDTISHGRVSSEVSRASGEVDAVMLPKESYYVNKVIYGSSAGIHIIGHWNYATGTEKNIYVAAKGVSSVELYINNEYVAAGTVSSDYLYTFTDIAYTSGTIRAVGKDINGNIVVEQSKTTHKTPDHIELTKVQSANGLKANGSDILLVDAEVVDADGNRCTTYDGILENDQLHFNITDSSNAFEFKGGYNSSIEYSVNSEDIYVEAGVTRVALRTTTNTGTVSITASTDDGLSTQSALTATSTAVDNTNGLCELDADIPFTINASDDPGIGIGTKPGTTDIALLKDASVLITNFSYTGITDVYNGIEDALSPGKQMYSDSLETFTTVPYKFYNAEYLKLPSDDNGASTADLINIEARRNIDIYILRDSTLEENPSWMDDYTLISDKIIGGNGVEYDMYRLTIQGGESATIGGNSDDGTSGSNAANNIIMFKETSKVTNNTFFNESFSEFDAATYRTGWNAYIGAGNTVTTSSDYSDHAMRFYGESVEDLVYVQKKFAPQTKQFVVKYKTYVTDTKTNKFNRIFLAKDYMATDTDKSQVAAETYISRNTTTSALMSRVVSGGIAGGTENVQTNISLNAWHTYQYYVDVENQTYKMKVDDGAYTATKEFLTTVDSVDTIIFGGGKAYTSDVYFDDVEITPVIENTISNVEVDNVPVTSFEISKTSYYISNLTSTSELTFDHNEYYVSSSTNYNQTDDCLELTVVDVNNETTTYYFYNLGESDVLNGWDVNNSTDANIIPGTLDDENVVIHLNDTSVGNMAYMQKTFGPETGTFRFSYDGYVTDTRDNTWLRVWLADGNMIEAKTNVGVGTYLFRDGTTLKIGHRNSASDPMEYSATTTTLNAWHNFEYIVDTQAQTYDVYIDDVLAFDDIEFYLTQSELDTMIFGTGGNFTSDLYLRNITYEHIYDSPLSGITINNDEISNFAKGTFTYNYYTEDVLSEQTDIDITTETYLDTHNIEKDIPNQQATITVTNISGEEFEYTINFIDPSQMNITALELQTLIDSIDDYDSTNYTNASWTFLQTKVTAGENILAQASPSTEDISTAYYEINEALDALLLIMDLTTYTSGYIDTIKYSQNFTNKISFDKVLDNGEDVYFNTTKTFRSVPFKYLNAEYLKLPNEQLKQKGEISFVTTKDIYLLVFKDRESGVLTDNTYTDTKDIVTGSDGTVYKVYRKFYASGSTVIIDTEELIQNLVTNKNNIIAIKGNYAVNNNKFLYEDFNDETTSIFEKSWNYSQPTGNTIELVDIDDTEAVDNVLHLVSTNTTSMPLVFKEFAKIYDKFTVSYKAKTDTSVDNKWNRIWILNGEIADGSLDWRENVDTKDNAMIESYLTPVSSVYSVAYRSSTVSGQNSDKQIGAFTGGQWGTVTYEADVLNKTFDAEVVSTNTTTKTGLSFLDSETKTFDYADNIEFAGRKTGNTNVYFDDIIIQPTARQMATSVTVDSNNVSTDYTALTKDYLYSASSITSKAVTVTTDKTKTQTTESDYENITLTDTDNYEVNQRIYYELNTDRALLTEYVELALSLEETDYTPISWSEMISALNGSKLVLEDSEASQNQIDASAVLLKAKIDALIDYNGDGYHYSGLIYEGNLLDGNTTNNMTITNDSSITMNALIDKTSTDFPTSVGERKLISSDTLPEGTVITFIDDSTTTPAYYYYEVTASDESGNKTEYLLSDFLEMGTDTENYVDKSYYSNNKVEENMTFIIDFEQSDTKLSNGTYTIKLNAEVGTETINMDALSYKIRSEKGTYTTDITVDKEIYEPSDDILINLTHTYTAAVNNNVNILDTTRFGKKYGIALSLQRNNEDVTLPKGTTVTVGNYKCYVTDGLCSLLVSPTLTNLNLNVVVDFGKYDLLDEGTYDLELDVLESYDGKNKGTVVGTAHQYYDVEKTDEASFKAELQTTSNIVKYGTEKELIYDFDKLNTSSNDIVVMLEKKNGTTYDTVDLSSYVDASYQNFSANNYSIGDVTSWTSNIMNDVAKGTYRFVFKLYSGTRIVNTEKEIFIVK